MITSAQITKQVAGKLPKGAITNWLVADAPASEVLAYNYEGHICDDGDPSILYRERVHTGGKHTTNRQWAEALIASMNTKNPTNPVCIIPSSKSKAYICVVRVKTYTSGKESNNE